MLSAVSTKPPLSLPTRTPRRRRATHAPAQKVSPRPTLSLYEKYLEEIRRHPVLSHEEIVEHYMRLERPKEMLRAVEEAHAPEPPHDANGCDTCAQARRLKAEIDQIINAVVAANLRLAVNIARGYTGNTHISFVDLIQEANLGLIRAAQLFDYRMGNRFSTYATHWIKQALMNGVDDATFVTTPRYVWEFNKKVRKAAAHLNSTGPVSVQDVAAWLEKPTEWVERFSHPTQPPISFSTPLGGENSDTSVLGDTLGEEDENPDRILHLRDVLRKVQTVLGCLTERERTVITLRFGIGCDRELTLAEVGEVLGVTRERIRQIEAQAIRKIRLRMAGPIN